MTSHSSISVSILTWATARSNTLRFRETTRRIPRQSHQVKDRRQSAKEQQRTFLKASYIKRLEDKVDGSPIYWSSICAFMCERIHTHAQLENTLIIPFLHFCLWDYCLGIGKDLIDYGRYQQPEHNFEEDDETRRKAIRRTQRSKQIRFVALMAEDTLQGTYFTTHFSKNTS